MSFVLTATGTLLLLLSLAAICFGIFMAMDPKNRDAGRSFAVWWIPAAAAASGVLMRDVVTFTVGLFCFLIAGATFAIQGGIGRDTVAQRTRESRRGTTGETKKDEDRAAS